MELESPWKDVEYRDPFLIGTKYIQAWHINVWCQNIMVILKAFVIVIVTNSDVFTSKEVA